MHFAILLQETQSSAMRALKETARYHNSPHWHYVIVRIPSARAYPKYMRLLSQDPNKHFDKYFC